VKLIIHLSLLPRLRMHGATPQIPHLFSWPGFKYFNSLNPSRKKRTSEGPSTVQESLMIKGLTINLFTVIFMSTNKDLNT